MKKHYGGIVILMLSWGINPAMEVATEGMEIAGNVDYFELLRNLLSTLTTIVVCITSVVIYKREKKNKKEK